MGASKTNHRPLATPTQDPGCRLTRPQARCPVALARTRGLWIRSRADLGRYTELEAPSLSPDTAPRNPGSFLTLSPGLQSTKRLRPAKSRLPGTTGRKPSVGNAGSFGVTAVPSAQTQSGPLLSALKKEAWASSLSLAETELLRTLSRSS